MMLEDHWKIQETQQPQGLCMIQHFFETKKKSSNLLVSSKAFASNFKPNQKKGEGQLQPEQSPQDGQFLTFRWSWNHLQVWDDQKLDLAIDWEVLGDVNRQQVNVSASLWEANDLWWMTLQLVRMQTKQSSSFT